MADSILVSPMEAAEEGGMSDIMSLRVYWFRWEDRDGLVREPVGILAESECAARTRYRDVGNGRLRGKAYATYSAALSAA